MEIKKDVFLCYRRRGAQTAKLFKQYLEEKRFPGSIWYSDVEVNGDYAIDVRLIRNAEDKNKISEYRNIARDVKNSYYIIKKKLAIAISLRRNEILKGIELDE
jgi:hypothetical protein